MWKPRPPLPAIAPELLQPALEPVCEACRLPGGILEHEHPHGARLAIARWNQRKRLGDGSLLPQCSEDPLELGARLRAEEGERDVQTLEGTAAAEAALPPASERLDGRLGKLQGKEETKPLISLDGSCSAHRKGVRSVSRDVGQDEGQPLSRARAPSPDRRADRASVPPRRSAPPRADRRARPASPRCPLRGPRRP